MKSRPLPLLFGLVLTVILAELVLRTLPVSTGYNLQAINDSNPILRGMSHSRYTYSRGWNLQLSNSGVLNNFGFRASYDYVPDPRAIAVIGNSFIQADAIDPRDTFSERLGVLLHRPTYAVGSDGFSLADYLAAARWSIDHLQSHILLVLLTTGDLKHACVPRLGESYLRTSDGAISLTLVERQEPSPIKRLLNDSRLFRYIFDNLRVSANWRKGWRRNDQQDSNSDVAASGVGCGDQADAEPATQFLLRSFHDIELSRRARVAFVLAPGYRREQGVAAGDIRDVDMFADRAAGEGFPVVRLEAAFAAALKSGTRLDFMPIDGHWNVAANTLAANVAATAVSSTLP
jgi:hypothetical protein